MILSTAILVRSLVSEIIGKDMMMNIEEFGFEVIRRIW